jgi:Fic family protein
MRITLNARLKIENAITLLRLENKKINANTVANIANVSYNTAKKNI